MGKISSFNPFIVYGCLCLMVISFYVAANTCHRHYKVDGQLYRALHISLPGYVTICYPEQTVDLGKWVGSKYGTQIVKNSDGTESAEATAGLALKAAGIYGSDYELKELNGHYVLYRPERQENIFSFSAWYRIGKGVSVAY